MDQINKMMEKATVTVKTYPYLAAHPQPIPFPSLPTPLSSSSTPLILPLFLFLFLLPIPPLSFSFLLAQLPSHELYELGYLQLLNLVGEEGEGGDFCDRKGEERGGWRERVKGGMEKEEEKEGKHERGASGLKRGWARDKVVGEGFVAFSITLL